MRIVLVSFMACGKTTFGDLLAKKLNKLQIDLDQAIVEREKLTIPEIFAKFGEDHFRLCEHRALLANIGKDAVITTGTGICAMSWNGPQPGKLPCGWLWAISAQQFLRQLDIDLVAYVAQVGPVEADSEKPLDVSEIRQKIFQNGRRNWTPSLPRPLSGSMPWAIPARRTVFCWEFWPVAPLPVN